MLLFLVSIGNILLLLNLLNVVMCDVWGMWLQLLWDTIKILFLVDSESHSHHKHLQKVTSARRSEHFSTDFFHLFWQDDQ